MLIKIRKAQQSDLSSVLQLVKELAVYENAGDQVSATIDDYKNAFKENIFESQVAEINGRIVGMTLYYMTYSTWRGKMLYLEDFVVSEAYRSQGVGQMLFDAFLEEARIKKVAMVKWQVLDWNEPAIAFYEKNKAIIEKGWWNVKIFFD
jgi:GNAT superfamily N-acetyltransferase